MHHTHNIDCLITRNQLANPELISIEAYEMGYQYDPVEPHEPHKANFQQDTLCGFGNLTINEAWFSGFGDQCYVCDQVVRVINEELTQTESTEAVDKYLDSFPAEVRSALMPLKSRIAKMLDPVLPNTTECNPECNPMPLPIGYLSDDNHRRQVYDFKYDWNVDQAGLLPGHDQFIRGVIQWLNKLGYCSPYITSRDSKIDLSRPEYQEAIQEPPSLDEMMAMFDELKNTAIEFFANLAKKVGE